ncbi:hypothetical protein RND81_12G162500 [Saponaria officinalis]|uniref:GDSL esterase/lipase At1g09390-like n=1 Tax=Saponaria officinalis TaxID=3572 RepID=A0AAW1HBC3_SAPOF
MRVFLVIFVVVLVVQVVGSVNGKCDGAPIIFNFGDSNSDTGGLSAGLGYQINPPNGRTFFWRSTGRLSDGRLIIDFLCQSLNTPLLSPYLEPLGSNFRNGANFAVVGSSTLPEYVPFALNVQVMQFIHFKARSLQLGARGVINADGFKNALYMIDIGQNDLSDSFAKNFTYNEVVKRIPLVITEIRNAIKALYDQGGRKFWVHNTGPLGCLPQKLWLLQNKDDDFDKFGCIWSYNSAAGLFNAALLHLCREMSSQMVDATIVHVDIYSIKYDIISNAPKYGFTSPLMACCGEGGPPYNYNIKMTCGNPGSEPCNNGSQYVSWDGIHYTEAANAIVVKRILSMEYSTPKLSFDFFCHK